MMNDPEPRTGDVEGPDGEPRKSSPTRRRFMKTSVSAAVAVGVTRTSWSSQTTRSPVGPAWLPRIGSHAPVNFVDFSTEGTANHYWHRGRCYGAFDAWLTAVGGSFGRASAATYVDPSGNIATASSQVLRFTHDAITREPLGIIIEDRRTNVCLRSEEFSDQPWVVSNSAVTADDKTDPSGATGGDTLIDTVGIDSPHQVFQPLTLASGTTAAFSVYAKKGLGRYLFVAYTTATQDYITTVFDLERGVVGESSQGAVGGTVVSSSIEAAPNGYYRVSMVGSAGTANGFMVIGLATALTGNVFTDYGSVQYSTVGGENSVALWGSMAEIGGSSSSYIRTEATSETRFADSLTYPVVTSPAELTFAATGRTGPKPSDFEIFLHNDDSTPAEDNDVEFWRGADGHAHFLVRAQTVVVADIDMGILPDNSGFKVAYRARANDFAVSLNGSDVGTTISGAMATDLNIIRFGVNAVGVRHWFGTIKEFAVFDVAGSNFDLQRLSVGEASWR